MARRRAKVVVAMSGGVDSSVVAALLKQGGFEVVGMMLRLWSEPGKENSNRCCTPDSVALARRVAAKLDIPFYVIDAQDIFRQTVVQSFLDGYAAGVTPNPCLLCNRSIRWDYLLNHALTIGADYLATGHYARLRSDAGRRVLLRAVDRTKDQSYVLHVLNQEQLARTLLPLGEYAKSEVRALAESFSLPVAHRPESQDLCFLAGEDYRFFLRRHAPELNCPGPIVTQRGEVLGQHEGLAFYTIGQRKGLSLTGRRPFYVLSKDVDENHLVVGGVEELKQEEMLVSEIHWIAGHPPAETFRAEVKTRYTAQEVAAIVSLLEDNKVRVCFDSPQRAITPGQAAVFYEGEVVLGGGVIVT